MASIRRSSRKRACMENFTLTTTGAAGFNAESFKTCTGKRRKRCSTIDRRLFITDPNSIWYTKDIDYESSSSRFQYEHFQHILRLAATMAAAAAASTTTIPGIYPPMPPTFVSNHSDGSYYQVLADMRVIKYFFDQQETNRLSFSVPVWKAYVVGEYVYFPSEQKWIFVNACTLDDGDSDCAIPYYHQFGAEILNPPSESRSSTTKQRVEIPKIRYCAHRSHTPSTNFQEVVHREPVKEHWNLLYEKLSTLKREYESNGKRRRR